MLPGGYSTARTLEHWLQPWVGYLIFPLFAFANLGILLQGVIPGHSALLLPLDITAGLVLGKPTGILLFTTAAIKLKLARLPTGVHFRQIAATAMLCSMGVTMSIFIVNLAFGHGNLEMVALAKIGILAGSVISALLGYLLLLSCC